MDPLLTISAEAGFFTRQEAKAAGYADKQITRVVRAGTWHRIRRGAYVLTDAWRAMTATQRHRVRASAVLRSLGPCVALSHTSGVVRHDIECWGLNLDRVHVTRLDGGPGRIEGDVVHHEGFCADDDVTEVGGEKVLRAERCVLEAASRTRQEVALCLFNSGLRNERFDEEALATTYRLMEHWPFMHRVAHCVELADARSGSVGEDRGLFLFDMLGIPAPELQYEVRRPDGAIAGISDWAWPMLGVLGEFDGQVKYGRLLRPGQEPGDAVFAEKRREDELRELTGCRMFRLVWNDYDTPQATGTRIRRVLRLAS
ncbi:MAG: type IV toxin-antitoxin system AbiEi family antitoxin domain-containing protein [Nocardioides sp.]|uniref:type IV toxin-antitoxin system AbiEi family antitoxin domain-containing protein n=1 Tax=Nocardioides sp. TaxID=35761 RepID=UPI0039E2C3DA